MPSRSRLKLTAIASMALGCAVGAVWLLTPSPPPPEPAGLRALCSRCHQFSPPELLPKRLWRAEIQKMFRLANATGPSVDGVGFEPATAWFEAHAPTSLPPMPEGEAADSGPLTFKRRTLIPPGTPLNPAVSNLRLTRLPGRAEPVLVVCDMRGSTVMAFGLDPDAPSVRILATVPFPAHSEVVDLDADGFDDLLISDLGSFRPSDHRKGQALWLRGLASGDFEPRLLTRDLGRVADCRAADVDADGDLDVVVAAFGWRKVGDIRLLENVASAGEAPTFEPRILLTKQGTIHAPVADVNGDGNLDVVAVISQHHEQVVALLGDGQGGFREHPLFVAPHPDWGMSGGEVVDMDGDGDLDLLVTNGDTLDDPGILFKPHHGIRWLENLGPGKPFEAHLLAPFYGVHRAEPVDLDGDGDLDVVACAFLPHLRDNSPDLVPSGVPSLIWLERTGPDAWQRHVLETDLCDHASLCVGDLDEDGDTDIAVGHFNLQPQNYGVPMPWVTIWENRGRRTGGE